MHNCSLSNANFVGADLREATLRNENSWRDFVKATLANADIGGADFLEASIDLASFENTRGAYKAKNLVTTKVNSDAQYFSTVMRDWPERFVD